MKYVLVIYPDEVCSESPKNSRKTHCDLSITLFFERLRKEKNNTIQFLKTYGNNFDQSRLHYLDSLQIDLIVSYPFLPELETYTRTRGVLYFAFTSFAQDSFYFDTFWLSNSNSLNDFKKGREEFSSLPEQLSPLSNEYVYYSRFLPLPHKQANVFYQKDTTICLVILEDSSDLEESDHLEAAILAAVEGNTSLKGGSISLVLYGRSKKLLTMLASGLRRAETGSVHVIVDNFRLNENSVISMIQKSDIIFSWRNGLGLDGIVLKKPVIFMSADNTLFAELNEIINKDCKRDSLMKMAEDQFDFLNSFVLFLDQHNLLFSNVSLNCAEFNTRLQKVCLGQVDNNGERGAIHSFVSRTRGEDQAIVADYVDYPQKVRGIFLAILGKKERVGRKLAKFRHDPRAFCRDSKSTFIRFLGSFL